MGRMLGLRPTYQPFTNWDIPVEVQRPYEKLGLSRKTILESCKVRDVFDFQEIEIP